ncbi:LysR family transcriptional regulator [Martelella lutilitoris]|uniref:LysR family transcriptional regulator n=1 Tax=Martelella lutilitoris TaxID=2583532 RepID=A0A5C4JLD1_9HYPH|nr:LysR family transcriptional regulator [Martelella lutilitoris]TNB46275.1 LysR family transcriptional regulator [Martelella lutilitoris]
MEVKWLEDFVALATTLNFSRAAEERHVTQSAFSRRIRQLETWLGATLIDRATYPSRLTEAGDRFLPVATAMLQQIYDVRKSFQAEEVAAARQVTLTALHTLSFTFLPAWLSALNRRIGPLTSQVVPDSGSLEENVISLVDGRSDFLLTYQHPVVPMLLDPQEFEYRQLGSETILPVSAPGRDGMPLHAIEDGFHSVAYQKVSFFGQLVSGALADRLPEENRVHVGSMSVGLKAMAAAGWGVVWVPESLVRDEIAAGTLVETGGGDWRIDVAIRLYRARQNRRPIIDRIWDDLERPDA